MKNLKVLLPAALVLPAQLLLAQAPIYDASQPRQQATTPRQSQSASPIPQEKSLQLEIYQQLKMLQNEMMELRGIVEEQGHELRTLKQQSLDRYIELDRRIAGGGGQSKRAESDPDSGNSVGSVPSEEIDAYRQAYELVKAKQFDQAIVGFDTFLKKFPDGTYAPNALYWKGELQLVSSPRDLKSAESAFSTLLKKYPDHSKVPDAMYKLGKVYFLSGEKAQSRKILNELLAKHGDSNRSAVKFARQFLQDNF
ncbi:tol-pal system protein YbgF [Litorivivens sp.]|uniref:tol-pal system protein YbgF n=3 Tax=Litorivivens sp. TaxID=2020868 RepID=UPI00356265C5